MNKRTPRISPSLLISAVALSLAVSGPAVAAVMIGTSQLKDGAVTTRKIRDEAVTTGKLAPAARPRLPRAYTYGNGGSSGNVPDTWTVLAELNLPKGKWAVTAKGIMYVFNSQLTCDLGTGADFILDRTVHSLFTNGETKAQGDSAMVLTNIVDMSAAGTLWIRCSQQYGSTASLRDTKIVATEVR